MKIVFNSLFSNSTYQNDGASVPGRMEAIMETLSRESPYTIVQNGHADPQDIAEVHKPGYIDSIKTRQE